jgi:Carboxypeptidase activation peptide
VTTVGDANFLKSLDGGDGFDFWSLTKLLGTRATVMVKPERQEWFENSLGERKIQYEISITDLEKYKVIKKFVGALA